MTLDRIEDAVPVEGLAVAGGEVGEVRRRLGDEEDGLGHTQVWLGDILRMN